MAAKDEGTFGSLFGKAKKWVENELVTSGDPMKDHGRSEANEGLEADMRLEAQRARDRALADVIVPGRGKQAHTEQEGREAARRETRAASVGSSRLTLRGIVEGAIDTGLAVRTERTNGTLLVTVEPLDPVPLRGGSFAGLAFAVPGYAGPGTYDLGRVEHDDPLVFELRLDGVDSEGFFWSPSYGPGVVTMPNDDVADIHFVYEDPGSNRVEVEGAIILT
jgi:hypothetical protein